MALDDIGVGLGRFLRLASEITAAAERASSGGLGGLKVGSPTTTTGLLSAPARKAAATEVVEMAVLTELLDTIRV